MAPSVKISSSSRKTSAAGASELHILSNGFKPTGAGGAMNGNEATYVFFAFAEIPFGGIKQTGYGREGGSSAIKDYLNVKYTHFGINY